MSTKGSNTVSSPDALVYIHSALAADPHKFTPALHLEAAAELVELRAWDEAEALYRGLLNTPSGRTEACMGLGRVALKRGRPTKAMSYFRTALAGDPTYVPALLELAAILCTDDLAEAEALYRAVLRGEADHPAALIGLGRITRLRAHSNLDSAATIFEASHKEAQPKLRPSDEPPPVFLTSAPTVQEEDSGGDAVLLEEVPAAQSASSSLGEPADKEPPEGRRIIRRASQSLPAVGASPPISSPIKSTLPNIQEEVSLQFLWADAKVHGGGGDAVLLEEVPAAQSASSSLGEPADKEPLEEGPTIRRMPPAPRAPAYAPSSVHSHQQVDSYLHAKLNGRRSGTVALACAAAVVIPVALLPFQTIENGWRALRDYTVPQQGVSNVPQAALTPAPEAPQQREDHFLRREEAGSSIIRTTGTLNGHSLAALPSTSATPAIATPSTQRSLEPEAVAWVDNHAAHMLVEVDVPQPAASALSGANIIDAPTESKNADILTASSPRVGSTTNVASSSLRAQRGEPDRSQPAAKDLIADPTGVMTGDPAVQERAGMSDRQSRADATARTEARLSLQETRDEPEPLPVDEAIADTLDGLIAERNDAKGPIHVEGVLEPDERTTGALGSIAASNPLLQAPTLRDLAEGFTGASARPALSHERTSMPPLAPDILASVSPDALSGAPSTTQVPSLPRVRSAPNAEALSSGMRQGPLDPGAAPATAPKSPLQQHRNETPAVRLQDGLTAPQKERLLARVRTLLDHRDVSGARLILEHLVRVGNRKAAFLLAQTYDPRLQAPWQGHVAHTNAARAEELYSLARNLSAGQTTNHVAESR